VKVQIKRLPDIASVNSVHCRHARYDVYTPNQAFISTDTLIGTAHDETRERTSHDGVQSLASKRTRFLRAAVMGKDNNIHYRSLDATAR